MLGLARDTDPIAGKTVRRRTIQGWRGPECAPEQSELMVEHVTAGMARQVEVAVLSEVDRRCPIAHGLQRHGQHSLVAIRAQRVCYCRIHLAWIALGARWR